LRAARVIAEALRFLNYASTRGGITQAATIYTATGELTSAAYRLPQLFGQLGDWLAAEARAGRIADDQHRPVRQLVDEIQAAFAEATEHAGHLGMTLAAVQSLTSGLHAVSGGDEQ
jgi:hypothetical protein